MSDTPKKRRWPRILAMISGFFALTLLAGSVALYLHLQYDSIVERPTTPTSRLVITNTRVLDVRQGKVMEPMDVVVENKKILSIAPHKPGAPHEGEVIDAKGKTLVPGLIDVHCHIEASSRAPWDPGLPIAAQNLERLLFAGVTRAFDPGARVPEIFELRDAITQGELLGPTIHTAGPMFTSIGGHPVPMFEQLLPGPVASYFLDHQTRQIGSPEDANREVARIASQGADFIKLTVDAIPLDAPRITEPLAGSIVEAATRNKLRTVAHIGTTSDAMIAGRAGAHAWVHGVYKERISDEDVAKLAAFKIPMSPTLIVFRSYSELGRGVFQPTELERASIPAAQLQALQIEREEGEAPENTLKFLKLLGTQQQNALQNVKRLHDAGVTILAGSDAQTGVFHGTSLHRELGLLRDAGLTNAEVLRSATLSNAQFLENTKDPAYGIVEAGKLADLILVDGDPLQDIAALGKISEVILGGQRLRRRPLSP